MVGESVVTGQARHRAAGDPTASATVISADDFAGEAKGVAELVSTAPGVAVDDYGGLGQLATASIRGANANGVLVLLDGIALQTAFGGGVDLSSIPRGWIDRIEVVRGVEGAHYGTGSLGGVLNVVTARPLDGRWSAEATAGSFGSFAGSAELGRAIGDGTLLLAVGGERTDGDFPYLWQWAPDDPNPPPPTEETRRNNGAWRAGFLAKASAPIGNAALDAVALLSAGRRELPGSAWAIATASTDRQADGRALLAARLAAPGPAEGLRLAGQVAGRVEWLDARLSLGPLEARFGALSLAAEATQEHRGGRLRLAAAAELDAARGDGVSGTLTRWRLSASAGDDLRIAGDRLRLAPAVRADRDGPFDGLSAKLGASWRIAGPVSLRASAGRTFRAPSEQELHIPQGTVVPNPALRPEVGLGGDAAVLIERGPVLASLGAHATVYDDLIYYQRVSLGRFQPFNAAGALVRGLEVEAATAPLLKPANLSLQGSWTLLDTEILRGVEGTLGNELPHRARHRLYGRLAAAPGPVELHAEAHVVGAHWDDDRNRDEVPAATLLNAGASVRLRRAPSIRLSAEVKNLADDRTLRFDYATPLPGRSVWFTVAADSQDPKGTP
jgi:iron complex outermembrane receptor protein